MTISDKLNEIEEQTKMLAQQAQVLEENKRNYEGLLECSIHDHDWNLGGVPSTLREVHMIHIECRRCGCYALFAPATSEKDVPCTFPLPIAHHTEVLLRDLIREEDE